MFVKGPCLLNLAMGGFSWLMHLSGWLLTLLIITGEAILTLGPTIRMAGGHLGRGFRLSVVSTVS